MYYVSLKNINQEQNLQIPLKKLKIINEHLSYLFPNQTIAPRYLARKAQLDYKLISKLLIELSFRGLIGVKFIIYCTNEDPDMVHGFEFDSEDDLTEFIKKQNQMCTACETNLNTKNIKVAFVIKNFENQHGEIYG
ncbi:hypothetical protein ACDI16_02030 [Oceanobacillus caeni]